jgi:hypothetical protein
MAVGTKVLFTVVSVQHILCFVFLHLVCPMLPVSLDRPFMIAPSVFSNVNFILIIHFDFAYTGVNSDACDGQQRKYLDDTAYTHM